jgi:hypothetical protein
MMWGRLVTLFAENCSIFLLRRRRDEEEDHEMIFYDRLDQPLPLRGENNEERATAQHRRGRHPVRRGGGRCSSTHTAECQMAIDFIECLLYKINWVPDPHSNPEEEEEEFIHNLKLQTRRPREKSKVCESKILATKVCL